MSLEPSDFLLGEFPRSLDDRFRLSIPAELADPLLERGAECALVKERAGCLSLWNAPQWEAQVKQGLELVRSKMYAGRLTGKMEEVQRLGRLLSTRHRIVQIAGRGRLVIPEGFREFLGVEASGDVVVVGAAVCIELWHPARWLEYLNERIPEFRTLFDTLSS
jgi:MraZ protein